jgi:hypothetical protein
MQLLDRLKKKYCSLILCPWPTKAPLDPLHRPSSPTRGLHAGPHTPKTNLALYDSPLSVYKDVGHLISSQPLISLLQRHLALPRAPAPPPCSVSERNRRNPSSKSAEKKGCLPLIQTLPSPYFFLNGLSLPVAN